MMAETHPVIIGFDVCHVPHRSPSIDHSRSPVGNRVAAAQRDSGSVVNRVAVAQPDSDSVGNRVAAAQRDSGSAAVAAAAQPDAFGIRSNLTRKLKLAAINGFNHLKIYKVRFDQLKKNTCVN